MLRMRPAAVAGLVLLAALTPLRAHHSVTADYDLNAPIAIHGRLARIEWTNPHAFLYIDITTENGTVETWQIEAAAPRFLVRVGLERERLEIGAMVDIKGLRARNGSHKAYGQEMTLPDGIARRLYTQQDFDPTRQKPAPQAPSALRTLAQNLRWSAAPYLVVTAGVLAAVIGLYVRRRTPAN